MYKSEFFVINFYFFDYEAERSSAAPENTGSGLESACSETAGSAADVEERFDNDIVLD